MKNVSLITLVNEDDTEGLIRTYKSLSNLSHDQWKWILVIDTDSPYAGSIRQLMASQTKDLSQISFVMDQGQRPLRLLNQLLEGMGDWVGFIKHGDTLHADALTRMLAARSDESILYSNAASLSRWGSISFQNDKPGLNPHRLLFQNYLQDLLLVNRESLMALGGFTETASDDPMHDVVLRTLEQRGQSAFLHVKETLYFLHRDRLAPSPMDPRAHEYVPSYDLQAIKLALDRAGIPAVVEQIHGTVMHTLLLDSTPSLTVMVFLPQDEIEGTAVLVELHQTVIYRRLEVIAVSRHSSSKYREVCRELKYTYQETDASEPELLNQQLVHTQSQLLLVLKGMPLGWDWLRQWVRQIKQSNDICAVGAKISVGRKLSQPGIVGWKYEGFDWNHRGRFSEIAVPHQVSMLSPDAVLIDVMLWRKGDPFDQTLPNYYMMPWGASQNAKGFRLIYYPVIHVVTQSRVDSDSELEQVHIKLSNWVDAFDLNG